MNPFMVAVGAIANNSVSEQTMTMSDGDMTGYMTKLESNIQSWEQAQLKIDLSNLKGGTPNQIAALQAQYNKDTALFTQVGDQAQAGVTTGQNALTGDQTAASQVTMQAQPILAAMQSVVRMLGG
jgi:hypothetical protein